jgi:DegV family protein with EDD domain
VLIVTDGAVDMPESLSGSDLLLQVPGEITGDGGSIRLRPEEFWTQLRGGFYPSTSPPSVNALVDAYRQSEFVVALHVSEQLSATVSRGREAAERVGSGVTVVDTGSLSVGSGLVVAAVHRACAQNSADGESVLELAKSLPPRLHTFAIIQNVESLRRSDRSGLLPKAHLARSHPLVLAIRGRVVPLAQPKHRRAAIEDLVSHIGHAAHLPGPWALGHGDAADVHEVIDEISHLLDRPPAFVSLLDPTVGVHVGPDALVVGVLSGPVEL